MSPIDIELVMRVLDKTNARRVRLVQMVTQGRSFTKNSVVSSFGCSRATAGRDMARARRAVKEHREMEKSNG